MADKPPDDGTFYGPPTTRINGAIQVIEFSGYALVQFGHAGNLFIATAGRARELINAGIAALEILDPGLPKVIDAIAGKTVLSAAAEYAEPDLPGLPADLDGMDDMHDGPDDVDPHAGGGAQPEDIPQPVCARCGAADTPLGDGDTCWNTGACGRRVQLGIRTLHPTGGAS